MTTRTFRMPDHWTDRAVHAAYLWSCRRLTRRLPGGGWIPTVTSATEVSPCTPHVATVADSASASIAHGRPVHSQGPERVSYHLVS